MSYIDYPDLYLLENGKPISSSGVNGNFEIIVALIDTAVMTVRTPSAIVTDLEIRLSSLEARTKNLENLSQMHARQRNEREYAPLSSVGAVLQRVDGLQKSVEDAVARLERALATAEAMHDQQHARLSDIEARPEMVTRADFDTFTQSVNQASQTARNAMMQAMSLRREVMELKKPDREANRLQYAPLAYIGGILSRLSALEAKK